MTIMTEAENRVATHARLAACETARKAATEAALAAGFFENAASLEGHVAATAIWNDWVETMQVKREALKTEGLWKVHSDLLRNGQPQSIETVAWFAEAAAIVSTMKAPHEFSDPFEATGWRFLAKAQFDNVTFSKVARFDAAYFEGETTFGNAVFVEAAQFDKVVFTRGAGFGKARFDGPLWLTGAIFGHFASFRSATFKSDAHFDNAMFKSPTEFVNAKFMGAAHFGGTIQKGYASFYNAEFFGGVLFRNSWFEDDANFDNVKFDSFVWFAQAMFKGVAGFANVAFNVNAVFSSAVFEGEAAFDYTVFDGYVDFGEATFAKRAGFRAAKVNSAFSIANVTFSEPPDFIQTKFLEPPQLYNVKFGAKLMHGDLNQLERLRRLRKIAEQAKDSDREHYFFAAEMRAARWTTDYPLKLHRWPEATWYGCSRFWFGYGYDYFADFGRSVFRPLLLLIAFGAMAAYGYLFYSPVGLAAQCVVSNPTRDALPDVIRTATTARAEAFQMAVRNAVVVLEGSAEVNTRALGCLYGFSKLEKSANGVTPRQLILPPEVSTIIGMQKFFSALALFLIGLGIRNMLKMK
jgi:Pentapeptide repeats (9 copies)